MTDYIASFDNSDVEYDISDLYCPDVVVQRKAPTHTLRRWSRYYYIPPGEYVVNVTRPKCGNDGIPVTEMDEHFSDKTVFNHPGYYGTKGTESKVSLGKKDLYDKFIFYVEELCSSKTDTYDKYSNMIKTAYKVPIIGFFKNETTPRYWYQSCAPHKDVHEEKFISIRHKLYSLDKYYRQVGLEYGELNIPKDYFEPVKPDVGEHHYPPHKTSYRKEHLTFSFHHDVTISSLVLKPEKMSFKHVHGDNVHSRYERQNTSLLRKQKYYIKVLENEPGFISKFEMQYRSELTNGQWVKHGIYNGNVSIADCVKISFDEIQVKEVRIIPISFHKSFDGVQINFVGKSQAKPSSDEVFVTYEVCTPRDGKYLTCSSKFSEKNCGHESDAKTWWKFGQSRKKRDKRDMIQESIRNLIRDY
jgi:hypothetical protein